MGWLSNVEGVFEVITMAEMNVSVADPQLVDEIGRFMKRSRAASVAEIRSVSH